MNKNLLPIAKEAFSYIGISFLATIFFTIIDFDILAFISFMIFISLVYIFRNPERELTHLDSNAIISPVDGVVRTIEECNDSEYSYKIEIEGRCRDVSLLRIPMHTVVENISKFNGTRVSKESKLFENLNEQATITFKDIDNNRLKIEFMLKNSFAPITIDLIKGQEVQKAQRFGLMLNGMTTLYLPRNCRVDLAIGNELKASESLIAYFS